MKKHLIQQVFKVCVYELSTVFVWQGDQIPRFTSSSLSFTRCVLDKPGIVPTVLLKMSCFNWLAQEENANTLDLKAEFTQKWKFCHQLLTSFQTCLTFFRNTRKDFKERWAPKQHYIPLTFFKILSFVFHTRKKLSHQVWNNTRESES